jgi:phosphatidylglycerophosphate synthase
VSGLRSIAASEGFTIQASELGKFKMLVQIISVVAVILARRWHEWPVYGIYIFPVYWIAWLAIWFMVLLSLVSALDYFCLLVAHRPQIGEAAAPVVRSRPAEKTRCPSCLKRSLKSRLKI